MIIQMRRLWTIIGAGAERKKAEEDIEKLKARINEMESELSRRGLSPDKQSRGPIP